MKCFKDFANQVRYREMKLYPGDSGMNQIFREMSPRKMYYTLEIGTIMEAVE